jgi:hypothetical protein
MAYATAGYEVPAERYRLEVERLTDNIMQSEVEMSEQIIAMLRDIQERLERMEGRMGSGGSAVPAAGGEFAAVSLSATIDEGKEYWKVKGGPFMKHGIIIWPEVLALTPFADADPRQVHDLGGFTAVYTENEEGHKKIVGLRPSVQRRDENGNPEYRTYADAAQPANGQPFGKDAESFAREHWLNECRTAVDGLLFDTAMLKLTTVFPDSAGVQWAREQLFGSWVSADAPGVTAGLLAYDKERKELNGSVSKAESHAAGAKAALAACGEVWNGRE